LGGFVLPLERLPEPIAYIAHRLPGAALTDALRAALNGTGQDVLGPLALLAAWAGVAIVGAALTFRAE
jgi:ABC-2 type transport system permease protein